MLIPGKIYVPIAQFPDYQIIWKHSEAPSKDHFTGVGQHGFDEQVGVLKRGDPFLVLEIKKRSAKILLCHKQLIGWIDCFNNSEELYSEVVAQ
jgi:hypothetical protein